MYNVFHNIEEFSQQWSNTIDLCNGIFSVLIGIVSILIAWLIFHKEQRISEDKSRQLFLSVLDEAGMQLRVMQRFSESLNSAVAEMKRLGWKDICESKDLPSFLLAVYTLKNNVHITRFHSSFRKFHSYDGLFDEYRAKKIALWRRGKKIDIDILRKYLKDFELDMKKCLRIQKRMSRLFPKFAVFFDDEMSKVQKLIHMIDECSTQERFAFKISQSGDVFMPNWSKAEEVRKEMEQYAKTCSDIYNSVENMLREFCRMYDINFSLLYIQIDTARRWSAYE